VFNNECKIRVAANLTSYCLQLMLECGLPCKSISVKTPMCKSLYTYNNCLNSECNPSPKRSKILLRHVWYREHLEH
jgi:hypothetical protein